MEQYEVKRNRAIHDRILRRYEGLRTGLFNDVEQQRLRDAVEEALGLVSGNQSQGCDLVKALDFGCGTGNLTSHLLALGCAVSVADVSGRSVAFVKKRYAQSDIRGIHIKGDLEEVLSGSEFDFIGVVATLHHIPDYVQTLNILSRHVTKGGVIYIDQEASPEYWDETSQVQEYKRLIAAPLRKDMKRFLSPSFYVDRLRIALNPRFTPEGDIHVFPDDHIEWEQIDRLFYSMRWTKVLERDYLNYDTKVPLEEFRRLEKECSDTRVAAYRNPRGQECGR
ncbi:MAG: methyltransferase domain-containing protein [Chitinivibrionales bacterium]|nr:methyltransferase domain-containing protein [Chitinivibrionales bacterium]